MLYNTKTCVRLLDKVSEWAIYIMIFVLPFSKSMIEITATIAITCFIIKQILLKKFLLKKDFINISLYFFIIASLLSLINTNYFMLSARAFFSKTLEYAFIFFIVQHIINTEKKLNNFLKIALMSCVLIIVDGFTQHYITHVDFLHQYTSFKYTSQSLGSPTASFPFPNDFSAWIIMFFFPVFSVSLFSNKRIFEKVSLFAISISLVFLLFLTHVRGAWMSFVGSCAILSFVKLKKIGIFLLILIITLILLSNKSVVQHALSTASYKDRHVMWKNSWEIFKQHPVIGNGLNTFFIEYKNIRNDASKGTRGSYAHNCYFQMAADTGILGLGAFLVFIGAIFLKGFKAYRNTKDRYYKSLIIGLILGLAAFLMHSFVDTNLYSLNLAVLFWLSLGILIASVKIAESEG